MFNLCVSLMIVSNHMHLDCSNFILTLNVRSTSLEWLLEVSLLLKYPANIVPKPVRPVHWGAFVQRIQLLAGNSSALQSSSIISPKALLQLASDAHNLIKANSLQEYVRSTSRSLATCAGFCFGSSRSSLWLPLDLFLEDAMDGSQVNATSAIEIITGAITFSHSPSQNRIIDNCTNY